MKYKNISSQGPCCGLWNSRIEANLTLAAAYRRLLHPKSICVIGGAEAAAVIKQSQKLGFSGDIWCVNPHRMELAGLTCMPQISDLPGVPDAVFIAIPADATIKAVRELSAIGAGGVICHSSGFAESGSKGRERERELNVVAGSNMVLVGPNCNGMVNYIEGYSLMPDSVLYQSHTHGAAILSQSGNISLTLMLAERSLPLSYVISIGNASVCGIHHHLNGLLADDSVTAIGIYLEEITDAVAFADSVYHAHQQGISIVVLKTGKSSLGAATTLSHTSAMAGSDQLYRAFFRKNGIAQVEDLEEMVEVLKFFTIHGTLPSNNIASLSCSGGEAALVADLAASKGLTFPPLESSQIDRLQSILGENVNISNPLDYHTYIWGNYSKLKECFTVFLSGNQSCTLLLIDYLMSKDLDAEMWIITLEAYIAAKQATDAVALVVSTIPECLPISGRNVLLENGIVPAQGLANVFQSICAAVTVGEHRKFLSRYRNPPPAEMIQGEETIMLDEWESKEQLSRFGLVTPLGAKVDVDNVLGVADRLGYPLVLKVLSKSIAHKSDRGMVYLSIKDPSELIAARDKLQAYGRQFILERMVDNVVAEIMVGIKNDALFGLTLLIGMGGVDAELLADYVLLLLPVTKDDIESAVTKLQLAPLLYGYRNRPKADIKALVVAILEIAQYAEEHRESLIELDVNPLLVGIEGQEVLMADALIYQRRR